VPTNDSRSQSPMLHELSETPVWPKKLILGELTNALMHLEPHGLGDGTRWPLKILNHPPFHRFAPQWGYPPWGGYPISGVGRSRPSHLHVHALWIVAEAIAFLGEVSDAGKCEVIREQAGPVLCEHGEHLHPALGRLLGIGVIRELG
jgi:hypothetical protein